MIVEDDPDMYRWVLAVSLGERQLDFMKQTLNKSIV
jgi:hypothetical protein